MKKITIKHQKPRFSIVQMLKNFWNTFRYGAKYSNFECDVEYDKHSSAYKGTHWETEDKEFDDILKNERPTHRANRINKI